VTVPAEVEFGWDAGGFEVGVSCHRVPIPAGAATGSDWVVVPDATLVLTVGLPMLKLASWALAALLLAGITGLLRKT
jgi:uncharacterized spore protein YtfJ